MHFIDRLHTPRLRSGLLLSVLGHVMLLAALLPFVLQPHSAGVAKTITVQLFSPMISHHHAGNQKHLSTAQYLKHSQVHNGKQTDTNKHPAPQKTAGNLYQTTLGHNALLVALHNAIQAKQQYPMSALMNSESGTATVRFRLNKQGVLSKIHIQQSSGYSDLDQAAVHAVSAISPFKTLPISATQWFHVPVSFQLSVV